MERKWQLYQCALEESFPLTWVILRMQSKSMSRRRLEKIRLTSCQRILGYARNHRKRKFSIKVQSIKTKAMHFLIKNVPIS